MLQVVRAAAVKDRVNVLKFSREMGFLTGDESNVSETQFSLVFD